MKRLRASPIAWKALGPHVRQQARWLFAALAATAVVAFGWGGPTPMRAVVLALGMALVLHGLHVLLALGGMVCSVPLEGRRKAQHLAAGGCVMGLAALAGSAQAARWAVVTLCAAMLLWMRLSRHIALAQTLRHLSMDRSGKPPSHGELLLPWGLGLAALLAGPRLDAWFFAAGVLTLADSAAALVGQHLGRRRYRLYGGRGEKSIEGSLAFVAVAWLLALCSVAPLAAMAPGAALLQAAIGLALAALLGALEALCVRGWDNLVLPVAAVLLAGQLPTLPPAVLPALALLAVMAVWAAALSRSAAPPPTRPRPPG